MRSTALEKTRNLIPHCISAALLDLSDGSLLASKADPHEPHERTTTAAVAVRDLLRQHLDGPGGDSARFEVIVASRDRIHIGLRSRIHTGMAVLLVCRAEVTVGMAIARARIFLTEIEEEV